MNTSSDQIHARTFFATHGPMTDPGPHAVLYDNLPDDIGALCKIVQGLMIHVFWAEQYGLKLPELRKGELQLRAVAQKLPRILELDPAALTVARPPERRLVGNCRDFSVLLASMLRHKGIPARARCGFGRYFIPNHYEDHWVGEYWNAAQQRWIMVDAQMDALQSNVLKLPFDPTDVPRDQFIVGGHAWQLCRSGAADPDMFGIFDMKGLWFVRGNFVRDVASLNKVELLPWDGWGLAEDRNADTDPVALAELDRMAQLTAGDVPDFDTVKTSYNHDARWRVPQIIVSYGATGPQQVALPMLSLVS